MIINSLFFPLSTASAEEFHFRILHRIPDVNIAPLVLEATEIAPLSLTSVPLLGSRKILEVRALLTIDRADLCGLSAVNSSVAAPLGNEPHYLIRLAQPCDRQWKVKRGSGKPGESITRLHEACM